MSDVPEKIWIEEDDCPYFYHENELSEVQSPTTSYLRSDIAEARIAELQKERDDLAQRCAVIDEALTNAIHLRKAAEADKAQLSETLRPFADMADYLDSETEGFADTDKFDLLYQDYLFHHFTVADFRTARAALSGSSASAGGWRFTVKDSDGRTWLELRSPSGATALLSCATNHAEGETIASQVLHQFALTLPAAPTDTGGR